MSRQIEMTWKCSSCSAQNLGRFKSCQTCRNPKDGSEQYEMPADPSKAATVTEAGLLRMATAGPDWRCAYCGSDQRRTDLGCQNCGADATIASTPASDGPEARPSTEEPDEFGAESNRTGKLVALGTGALVLLIGGMVGVTRYRSWNENRPRDYDAPVVDVSWECTVAIEKYSAHQHEGFAEDVPDGALEKKSLGQRQHHVEQVFDHYETEHYSEQVPDGYRTETYTEQESCGQTCTSRPQSCREQCTSNKNGFATCRQVCSGGGQSCSTKYCSRTRTRQIPQTRSESRSRQVQKFRDVPRFAEAFAWTTWEWTHDRFEKTSGADVNVHWPAVHTNALDGGEREREASRTEALVVVLRLDENQEKHFRLATEEQFAKFPPGSRHQVHVEAGQFTVDGAPLQPTR